MQKGHQFLERGFVAVLTFDWREVFTHCGLELIQEFHGSLMNRVRAFPAIVRLVTGSGVRLLNQNILNR
jgi:hypothetical protein